MKNIKQKICGIIAIAISIITICVTKDATIAILFAPFGLYLVLAKENLS